MSSRLTSDMRMPGVPIVMPSEIETVLNSIGVPPAVADALAYVHGQVAQVVVAGADFNPGVGDADEGPAEVLVGEADRFQHGSRGRPAGPLDETVAALFRLRSFVAHARRPLLTCSLTPARRRRPPGGVPPLISAGGAI